MLNRLIDSLYKEFESLNKIHVLEHYIFALKTNMFHLLFNAWISVLSVTAIVCFSGLCGVEIVCLNQFVFSIIFLPICFTSLLAFLDILFILFVANKKICKIFREYKRNKDINIFKKELDKKIKQICSFGFILHIVFAVGISLAVPKYIPQLEIKNYPLFFGSVVVLTGFCGLIWNLSSMFRLKRIDCNGLLSLSPKENNSCQLFKYYFLQFIFEGFGCLLILASFIIYYLGAEYNNDTSTYYGLFYLVCFSLVSLYARQIYKWEFPKHNSNNIIYPTYNIFNDKSDTKSIIFIKFKFLL